MKIIKTTHYSYQRDTDVYSLTNLEPVNTISYTLTRLRSVDEDIVVQDVILAVGETKIIVLPTEWHYALKVTYLDATAAPTTEIYHIAYFPTVKQQLIIDLKNYICKNSTEVQLCVTGSKNIKAEDINATNLLFNSMQSYLTILTSQSLLRDYQGALTKGMFLNMDVTVGLLQTYYDVLFVTSDTPKSGELLRFYLVVYYTLFLLVELDISLVTITDNISTYNYVSYNELLSPPLTDSTDLTAVKELFDYPAVKDCIMMMKIDFITLYNSMISHYLNINSGISSTFIANFLGLTVYYGTPGATLFTGQ